MIGASRVRFVLGVALAASVVLGGCGGSGGESGESGESGKGKAETTIRSYTVRGEVVSLPSETSDLLIRHETIPEFVRPDGSLGMTAMTMAFWPPQGLAPADARVQRLDLSGIEVGEKVSVTFEVVHEAGTNAIKGYYASSIEALPAETALDFSALEGIGE